MRRVLSVVCYAVAGFVLYGLCLVAFAAFVPRPAKLSMLGIGAVAALAVLGAGLAASRYRSWRRDVGIVFVAGGATTLLVVLNVLWMLYAAPPRLREVLPPDLLVQFGDWPVGLTGIGGLIFAGVALLRVHAQTPTAPS